MSHPLGSHAERQAPITARAPRALLPVLERFVPASQPVVGWCFFFASIVLAIVVPGFVGPRRLAVLLVAAALGALGPLLGRRVTAAALALAARIRGRYGPWLVFEPGARAVSIGQGPLPLRADAARFAVDAGAPAVALGTSHDEGGRVEELHLCFAGGRGGDVQIVATRRLSGEDARSQLGSQLASWRPLNEDPVRADAYRLSWAAATSLLEAFMELVPERRRSSMPQDPAGDAGAHPTTRPSTGSTGVRAQPAASGASPDEHAAVAASASSGEHVRRH